MNEPRGAVTGDVPETLAAPEDPDAGTGPATNLARPDNGPDDGPVDGPDDGPDVRAADDLPDEASDDRAGARGDDRLDASAHAHLLEEPLPPEAATETAVIYNVTLAAPHPRADDPVPAEPSPVAPVPVRRTSAARRGPAAADPSAGDVGDQPLHTGPPTASGQDGQDGRDDAARRTEAAAVARAGAITASRAPAARRAGAAAAVVLVGALATLAGYLWISATEWRDQAGVYQRAADDLGEDLASTRNQLAGSQAELEAVRAQLSTAHARIVELADEKNQALDDWEITQQLVDYQQRISDAAGTVALALDQCVQGQQELIGYLEQQVQPAPSAPPYDPVLLEEFETQVEALCQEASEANIGLQLELAR